MLPATVMIGLAFSTPAAQREVKAAQLRYMDRYLAEVKADTAAYNRRAAAADAWYAELVARNDAMKKLWAELQEDMKAMRPPQSRRPIAPMPRPAPPPPAPPKKS